MNQPPGAASRYILFTRYPEPGTTKTRLAPVLGREGAAELQRCLTEDVVETLALAAGRRHARVEIRFAGGDCRRMARWLGPGAILSPQGGGDLGERLARACSEAFAAGEERVVVLGSDIPGLGEELLVRAMRCLEQDEVVLGPCADGGYYLIGFTRESYTSRVFADIAWSSPVVLDQTRQRLEKEHRRPTLLAELHDLDREEDLYRFARREQEKTGRMSRARTFLAGWLKGRADEAP